MMHLTVPFTAI